LKEDAEGIGNIINDDTVILLEKINHQGIDICINFNVVLLKEDAEGINNIIDNNIIVLLKQIIENIG
jgi:hypothetical protein